MTLQELARRTGVMELQLFVVAMLVHGTSGGNPVEILDNLSDVIRKRIRLVGKVKALTSEGRLQAVILSILPVGAFVAIFVLNRSYAQLLLDRPRLLTRPVLVFEVLGGPLDSTDCELRLLKLTLRSVDDERNRVRSSNLHVSGGQRPDVPRVSRNLVARQARAGTARGIALSDTCLALPRRRLGETGRAGPRTAHSKSADAARLLPNDQRERTQLEGAADACRNLCPLGSSVFLSVKLC